MDIKDKEAWRASRQRPEVSVTYPVAPSAVERVVERVVQEPPAEVLDKVAQLEASTEALSQALAEAASDRARLMDICKALDERISSFAVKVERAA